MSGTSLVSISPACWATDTVWPESAPISCAAELAALGEFPHLRGHHREATAVLASAGRFDRRVQGQKIGLARDLLHDGDLLGNGLHGSDSTGHSLAAGLGVGRGLPGYLLGLACIVGTHRPAPSHGAHSISSRRFRSGQASPRQRQGFLIAE